jgi:hypothetical protein
MAPPCLALDGANLQDEAVRAGSDIPCNLSDLTLDARQRCSRVLDTQHLSEKLN